jgi:hypothetical protein
VEWGLSACCGLYPDATVCLLILRGFTSWSSVREPTQVFTLLETLYGAFDAIAKRRGVFKETIGDSYVAVVGLPTPKGSYGCMVRFASDCRDAMMIVTRKLEVTLGPTPAISNYALVCTADLSLRVFYVVKSRFQLLEYC